MARGAMVGCTDYSHQSFEDVIQDLVEEAELSCRVLGDIDKNIAATKGSGYWQENVPSDFELATLYALKHFRNAAEEMQEIAQEVQNLVEEHHCSRLRRIAEVAHEIHANVGIAWHQHYPNQEYGNEEFRKVEKVFTDIRGIAGNLYDVANMAARLEDFVGKGKSKGPNPWVSGTFYLFAAVVVVTLVAIVASTVSWVALPVVLVAGILIIGLLGALQLRNDDQLSEAGFISLFIETYKRLPLLRKF